MINDIIVNSNFARKKPAKIIIFIQNIQFCENVNLSAYKCLPIYYHPCSASVELSPSLNTFKTNISFIFHVAYYGNNLNLLLNLLTPKFPMKNLKGINMVFMLKVKQNCR